MNLSLPLFDDADALLADDGLAAPGVAPVAGWQVDAFDGLHDGAQDGLLGGLQDDSQDSSQDGSEGDPHDAAAQPPPGQQAPDPLDLALHPGVWRASQVGGGAQAVSPSGFAALDALLPGGGWPHGALTELLLPQPGIGELRLLAPVLAAVAGALGDGAVGAAGAAAGVAIGAAHGGQGAGARRSGPVQPAPASRCVMLFDPPASLSAWALAQCGLSSRHWLVVRSRSGHAGGAGSHSAGTQPAPLAWRPDTAPGVPRGASRLAPLLPGADLLWALEQALKSGHVGAVLAWLPVNLRADALRRLQLAAQAQDGPVFIFRDALARGRPSPAPLRLLLQPAGVDGLALRLLKRRGPLLAQPLRLVLPPVLPLHLQALAEARQLGQALARGRAGVSAGISAADSAADPAG